MKGLIKLLLLVPSLLISTFSIGSAQETKSKILTFCMPENIKSNYFYNGLVAEQMGISVDSLDFYFNGSIAQSLQTADNAGPNFTIINEDAQEALLKDLDWKGEGEDASVSLEKLSVEAYGKLLTSHDANYFLVIDQHYLKKVDDEAMTTIFHIVSYSLYDQNKQLVNTNNFNLSSMKLDKAETLAKKLKKASSKIPAKLAKQIKS